MGRQRSVWHTLLTPLCIGAFLSGCQRGQMGSGSGLGAAEAGSSQKTVSTDGIPSSNGAPVGSETLLHDGDPPFNPWESLDAIRTRLQHELLAAGFSEALVQRLAASLAESKFGSDVKRTAQTDSAETPAVRSCPSFFRELYGSLTDGILTSVPEALNETQSHLAMGLAQKSLLATYELLHEKHPLACEMSLEPFVSGHLQWKQGLRAKAQANSPAASRLTGTPTPQLVPPTADSPEVPKPPIPADLQLVTGLSAAVGRSGMEPAAVAELLAQIPTLLDSSHTATASLGATEMPASELLVKAVEAALGEGETSAESVGSAQSAEEAPDATDAESAESELLVHLTENLVRSLVIELAETEQRLEPSAAETTRPDASVSALEESVTTIAQLLHDQDDATREMAIDLSAEAADEAIESFPLDEEEQEAIFKQVEDALAAEPQDPARQPSNEVSDAREKKMRTAFRSALARRNDQRGSLPDLSISSGTLEGQPGDILFVQLRLTPKTETKGERTEEGKISCLENCADLVLVPQSRLSQMPQNYRMTWPTEQTNGEDKSENSSKSKEKRNEDVRKAGEKEPKKERLKSHQTTPDEWNTFWEKVWAPLLEEQQQASEALKEARELCRLNHSAVSQKIAFQECLQRNSEKQNMGTFTGSESIILMKRLPRENETSAGKGFCVVLRVSGQGGSRRVLVPFNGATLVNPESAPGCGFP